MKISKSTLFLMIIVLLAAFLRLWKLGSIPSSLTQDEASLGYNAYSILKTGKDEYGTLLPVVFKSFGDFKPGLYVYAAVPFVWIFGLNEVSVRLPSALSGVLIVYLIFLIFTKTTENSSRKLPLFGAFLASVNPWLIYYSRGAWEANLSLCLVLLGIYYFLTSFKKSRSLILSSGFFALTFWAYQGAKLSTSIVLVILTIVYWKECKQLFKKEIKSLFVSTFLGILIVAPVIITLFNGQTGRLSVFSVFSYPRPFEYTKSFLDQGNEKINGASYLSFHSETINFARGILGRWYNHFSGKFLFFQGDYQNPMHSAPNSGMLLFVDLILLPLGFIYSLRQQTPFKKALLFWFLWIVLAPLPAILSRDQVQSVRAFNMAIPLVFFSSLGLFEFVRRIEHDMRPLFGYLLFVVIFSASIVYFLDSYFVHFPEHNAKYWLYGYKQVVEKITPLQNDYDRIIFQQSYNQPYVFFLFYQKYDPRKYQSRARLISGGSDVGLVEKLDNIDFSQFSWPPAIGPGEKVLIVGDPVAIPPEFSKSDYRLISEIKYPDNFMTAFRILENK